MLTIGVMGDRNSWRDGLCITSIRGMASLPVGCMKLLNRLYSMNTKGYPILNDRISFFFWEIRETTPVVLTYTDYCGSIHIQTTAVVYKEKVYGYKII
jgi:hypothetical protein